MMDLNEFAKDVHQNAVKHGWWEEERTFPEIIALCHSELSEALEEYRNHRKALWFKCPKGAMDCDAFFEETDGEDLFCHGCDLSGRKPEGMAVELIDCVIRILDWFGKEKLDVEKLLNVKHEYNQTRTYKHGGKVC